jgi:pyruvate,orthophosphate dikinase
MDANEQTRNLTALEINLERTRAMVEIPDRYGELLLVAKSHSAIGIRTEEMLKEFHHPYVNWDYLLEQLKGLSIGEFTYFNNHKKGFSALESFADIYLDVISLINDEGARDSAVRYCFEYLEAILSKSGKFTQRNRSLLFRMIASLSGLSQTHWRLFKKASGYAKALAKSILETGIEINDYILSLVYFSLKATYKYWLEQPDPANWFPIYGETDESRDAYRKLIAPLSHEYIRRQNSLLEDLEKGGGKTADKISGFLDFPDHVQIANGYLTLADMLEKSSVFAGHQYLIKLDFLFKMMGVEGLSDRRNAILTEINRCLGMVLKEGTDRNVSDFVHIVFGLLKKIISYDQYKNSVLDCISTLAKEIFALNNHALVDDFIEELVEFGFQYPEVKGATTHWQIQVNPAHVKNIRSWLEIISFKPRWTKKLLSALIINLKLGGIFVRDTDLLQKDISRLLNADILPAYNQVKQLLRLFPVYYRDIGAEGELRAISTEVDELSKRNDRLVYFVRKQSHVESNSLLVSFIEDILRYWSSGNKSFLKKHLPDEIYSEITPAGEYFDELNTIFSRLSLKTQGETNKLLQWDAQKIAKEIESISGVKAGEKKRAELMIRLYQLLYSKYFYQHIDILSELEKSPFLSSEKVSALKSSMKRNNCYRSLNIVLDILSFLKKEILSSQKTDYFEDIYYKRHIAAGIPSMYGTYREEKFEAMGLVFRLECFATNLFQRLVESVNLKFITKSTLIKIHKYLWLYIKALELEGITTEGLVGKLRLISNALQIRQFTIDQYIDIFQFIEKGIQETVRDYCIDFHRSNLAVIVRQLTEKSRSENENIEEKNYLETFYQYSESFGRSIIASTFGLQVFDCFVSKIIKTLSAELERLKDNRKILNQVMAYVPELAISSLYKKNRRTDNQIMIGNKAYMLKELISFNLPVPPGFVITTEVFRGYEGVLGHKNIYKDLRLRVYKEIKELERITGKIFGNPENPLLLSVRSGATMSLPGMMRSFLNVGINETIAEGLARKNKHQWASWDSYRRFLQTWGMFRGLERNIFDEIMNNYKAQYMVAKKLQFDPEQMKKLAISYKEAIMERGIKIPYNPYKQLQHAVIEVFASWNSEQARTYRRQARLSDEWGTAVIVQSMVYGNLHENSGSGVIFTRDPKGSSQDVSINGDFIFCVQGDDIVSGLVETFPVSEKQRIAEKREAAISLQTQFPEIYKELVRIAELLIYEKGFNHQEIEFTFENPAREGLYILQTRDMVQRGPEPERIFKSDPDLERSFLGTGVGVSGGALTGRAVYTEEEIEYFRSNDKETALILIRPDTVPDDIGIILKADGILTAKGGSTSHAAVTIPQLDKVGVVGFSKLQVYESERYSKVDKKTIRGGDFISIDGWSGAVYMGKHPISHEQFGAMT